MRRSSRVAVILATLLVIVGCLGLTPSAEAKGNRAGTVDWGSSGCVYDGTELATIKLERIRVTRRIGKRWNFQYGRIRVVFQAQSGGDWTTVRSLRARTYKIRSTKTLWARSPKTFTRIRSASAYRANVTVSWFAPRTGKVAGATSAVFLCTTRIAPQAVLSCPTGLHWSSDTVLAWSAVPAATSYRVRQQRVDGALLDPVDVSSTSWAFTTRMRLDPNVVTWVEPVRDKATMACGNGIQGVSDRLVLDGAPQLLFGAKLTSPDGRFTVGFQWDGNFVLWDRGVPAWNIGTATGSGSYAVLQEDGNFGVYPGAGAPARWAALGYAPGRGTYVTLGNDGYLTLWSPAGQWLWRGGNECNQPAGCRSA